RDGRRVDDGQHLLEVLVHEGVEQDLVAVLQRAQVHVPAYVGRRALVVGVGAGQLLFQRRDVGRQQALETERHPLLCRERGAPVEERQSRQEEAGQVG